MRLLEVRAHRRAGKGGGGMSGREQEQVSHEITCCYEGGGPGEPYYQAVMQCGCGFSTDRCANWEDAGRLMDHHLDEVRP